MSKNPESYLPKVLEICLQFPNEPHGLFTNEEISAILAVESPCLTMIKPHASDNQEVFDLTHDLFELCGLEVLLCKRTFLSRGQVFGFYGDLSEVMDQGEKGVELVESLVGSFTSSGEAILMVVHGKDSYYKTRWVKKVLREIAGVDLFRNVMHSSDDQENTFREILALMS